MAGKLRREAYRKLIEEDREWLLKAAPDCLERQHILSILSHSEQHEYDDQDDLRTMADMLHEMHGGSDLIDKYRSNEE